MLEPDPQFAKNHLNALPSLTSRRWTRCKKSAVGTLLGALGAIALTGCTESLENSLAADPSLSTPQPTEGGTPQSSPSPETPSSSESTPASTAKTTTEASSSPEPSPEESPTPEISPAPAALQPYLDDWDSVDVLDITDPNQPITRRTLARWLFAANNALYSDRPTQQIRPAQANTDPIFQDINDDDPDFAAIQGLAESGIIPSSLTGSTNTIKFNPDAIASRETLLRWKVPLDFRTTLSPATVDAVAKAWGFQDVNKIDPNILKFILADYENGDLSNIRRTLGFTTLLQPKKSVTQGEAAAALWHFGLDGQGKSAADLDIVPPSDRDSSN
ncbi:MAG: S-layer homology domain-containing protein [Cyanobacteria bacterium P01_F01_bin.153]